LLQISEDSKFVACAAGYEAVILNIRGDEVTGLRQKLSAKSQPARSWSVAISAEAGLVAAGYDDGTVSVWSLDSGQLLAQRRLGDDIIYGVTFAGLSAGARFAKQQALLAVTLGEQVVVLSAAPLRVLGALPDIRQSSTERSFTSVCADRDGGFIAAGRRNGQVQIWLRGARESYSLLHSISLPGDIIRVVFPARACT
jgi:WD40 repeat protein